MVETNLFLRHLAPADLDWLRPQLRGIQLKTGDVVVRMTLTSPGCPAGGEIIEDVKRVVGDLEGVQSAEVELVWDPYWTPERMDPRVRAFLGF